MGSGRVRMTAYDAVVVGSGPNGLVGALTLAEAGRKVLLLEAADHFGGGLRSEELTLPGRVHDVCATVLPLALASPAFRALGLTDMVKFVHPEVPAAHPLDGRDAVLMYRDADRTAKALGPDAGAWQATVGAAARAGLPLIDLLLKPLGPWLDTITGVERLGAQGRLLASAGLFGAQAVLPATVAGRMFRTVGARAALAGMAAHSTLDLRAPITTGYGLMLASLTHLVGWPMVEGGSQVLADAMVARLRALGGDAVSGHRVRHLRDLPARTILLDVMPRHFATMAELPPSYRRALIRHKHGPGVFKVDWALDGPVPWRDPRVAGAGTVHQGGTMEEIAPSEAEVARGRHCPRPYVRPGQPYAADPTP